MSQLRGFTLFVLGLGVVASGPGSSLHSQTKYPGLDLLYPVVVSRGTATEVDVHTNGDVQSAHLALVEGPGLKAAVLPRPDGEKKLPAGRARIRVDVDAEAPNGPRDLRLVTDEAITTVGRLYVSDLPAILEAESHSDVGTSQVVELPVAINGRITGAVETDWYRFEAKAGELVHFEVIGTRIHETIHKIGRFTPHFDAFISLRDADGRELAAADDHYFADPLLTYEIPADGTYHVVVREANFKGHASYTYALLATKGPVPTSTFPLAVVPGVETEVELLGSGIAPGERATILLSEGVAPGRPVLVRPRRADGSEERELLALPTGLPPMVETESDEASKVDLPVAIAGRLDRPDDVDGYSFEARKGVTYRFTLTARRLFSPIDGQLEVVDAKGKVLKTADDGRDLAGRVGRDPELEWAAPADGTYQVRVRDLHARGGQEFVYHLEIAVATGDFELTFDPELAMVAPGNRTPVYVRAHRRAGFDGEIRLEVVDLPEGVDAFFPPIRAGMKDACVVLSVSPDARPAGSMFRIRGEAEALDAGGQPRLLRREALPLVEIYQAQRVTGRTGAMAVTARSDIRVETDVEEITLKPGETKIVPVKLTRDPKYASGSVTLWGDWRFGNRVFGSSLPPGVTVNDKKSQLGVIGEGLEGSVALTASKGAKAISKVPTVVIGLIPIEFSVFVPFSTKPIYVTVTREDGTLAAR